MRLTESFRGKQGVAEEKAERWREIVDPSRAGGCLDTTRTSTNHLGKRRSKSRRVQSSDSTTLAYVMSHLVMRSK